MSGREMLLLGCATLALIGLLWLSILDAPSEPRGSVVSCLTIPEAFHGNTIPHTQAASCADTLAP